MCDSRANAFIHVAAYRNDLETKESFTFNRIPFSPPRDFNVASRRLYRQKVIYAQSIYLVYSTRFLPVKRFCKSVNATWSLRVSYVSKLPLGKYVIKVSLVTVSLLALGKTPHNGI